jgi:hypothetical protein
MLELLSLLTRATTTVLFSLAALLRFYGTDASDTIAGFTLLGWSYAAFYLASAALLVDLGIGWQCLGGRRSREAGERAAAAEARDLQARCLPGLLRAQRRDTAAHRRANQRLIAELAPELLDRPI